MLETYPEIIAFDKDVLEYFRTQYVLFPTHYPNFNDHAPSDYIFANTISISRILRKGTFLPWSIHVKQLLTKTVR